MNTSLLSIPNALTFLRFLGIPLFVYLTLSIQADGWAIVVLAIGGATDYFDGKLARALGQESKLGEILDRQGDRGAAETMFARSIELRRANVAAAPTDLDAVRALGKGIASLQSRAEAA